MNIEDHPGYQQALGFRDEPLQIVGRWLVAQQDGEPTSLTFYDQQGNFQAYSSTLEHLVDGHLDGPGSRPTDEEMTTFRALAQLHA